MVYTVSTVPYTVSRLEVFTFRLCFTIKIHNFVLGVSRSEYIGLRNYKIQVVRRGTLGQQDTLPGSKCKRTPDKGRGTTGFGRPHDQNRRNLLCGLLGSVLGPSPSTAKKLTLTAVPRYLTFIAKARRSRERPERGGGREWWVWVEV